MQQSSPKVCVRRKLAQLLVCLVLGTASLSAQKAPAVAAKPVADPRVLAHQQGEAEKEILNWILQNSGPLKGDIQAAGLRVAFSVTPAEGWWDKAGGGKLAWHEPPTGAVHLRLFVLDLASGRMMPGLTLHATLTDANGNVQTVPADFGWYPLMSAYGGNVALEPSSYRLHVSVYQAEQELGEMDFPPVEISATALKDVPLATAVAATSEAPLLKPANAAQGHAMEALWTASFTGAEKAFGDYYIAYAVGPAGMLNTGEARRDGMALAVVVRDARTGRLIPSLLPQATFAAADGKPYNPGELKLLWHPWLTHYGRAIHLEQKQNYRLRIHLEAPGFRRWGRASERFAVPADVEFEKVSPLGE